jgi:hypothetical protein
VGVTASQGSHGAASALLTMVAVVTVFSWLGGLVSGARRRWWRAAAADESCGVQRVAGDGGRRVDQRAAAHALARSPAPAPKTGLAEGARSVAGALDSWPGDSGPEPDGRRGSRVRAYAPLRSARIACGLYRSGGHVDQRWPVPFVVAVDQVIDRAVALHSLCVRPGALTRAATAGRVRGRGHRRGHAAAGARRRDRDGYRPAARRAGGEAGRSGALALPPGRITLLVLIFVSGTIGFTLRSVSTGYRIMFGTPMTMLLIASTAPLNWTAGLLDHAHPRGRAARPRPC